MGGYFSGRQNGRPIKEQSHFIDIARMLREGWISEGCSGGGTLNWSRGGEPTGSIGYSVNLLDPDNASMTLIYRRKLYGGEWEDKRQIVPLTYTQPHFGGRRWFMICPISGLRVGKLYLPAGGDVFAGQKAWRLGYRSQRITSKDRPFEALFRLQRRLGCDEGWEQPIRRPKGMWQRTFDRLEQEYWELDRQCAMQMMAMASRLRSSIDP